VRYVGMKCLREGRGFINKLLPNNIPAGDVVSYRGDEVKFLRRKEKVDRPFVRFVYFHKRQCSNCIGDCSVMEAVCPIFRICCCKCLSKLIFFIISILFVRSFM
jgi:hypothetical protein